MQEQVNTVGVRIILLVFIFLLLVFIAGRLFILMAGVEDSNLTPFFLVKYWFSPSSILPSYRLYFLLASAFIFFVPLGVVGFIYTKKKNQIYGNAHFMSNSELSKAGMLMPTGVLLGKTKGLFSKFICVDGQMGIILVAPPRAGKGIGPIICNILNYKESILVIDLRGETYEATSGYRAGFSKVYRLDPLNKEGRTHRYNPFDFLPKNRGLRIKELQGISNVLIPTPPKADPMWTTEARDIFEGFALYLYDINGTTTLGDIGRKIKSTPKFPKYIESILKLHGDVMDDLSKQSFNSFLSKASKEQSGVLTTVKSALKIFTNPLVDAATSSSDFEPKRFRQENSTLYIVVSPSDLDLLQPFLNFFTQTFFSALVEEKPNKETDPYSLLAIMDEFTSLGSVSSIRKGAAYFAGYNIILMPVVQDISQLSGEYDKYATETFLATSKYREFYAPNNESTAESLSRMLGHKTAVTHSNSQGKRGIGSQGSSNRSKSFVKVRLMEADAIMRLPRKLCIILSENNYPVLCKKLNFLTDKYFKSKRLPQLALPDPVPVVSYDSSIGSTVSDNERKSPSSLSDDELAAMVDNYIEECHTVN